MALTRTQSDFLLNRLGVAPKGHGDNPLSKNSRLRRKLEDYLRREEKVVDAVNALRDIDVADSIADHLENQMKAIQKTVTDAERDGGGDALKAAFESLEAIKTHARDALLPAYRQYAQQRIVARAAVGRLMQPVLGEDVKRLRQNLLTGAEDLARAGQIAHAIDLLRQVDGECTRLHGLANAYKTVLPTAHRALQDARPRMLKVDIEFVQLTLLDAADVQAAQGKLQAAVDLLAEVVPHCTQASSGNLQMYDWMMRPLEKLKKHSQARHFSAEIAHFDKRVTLANKLSAVDLQGVTSNGDGVSSSPVSQELKTLYFDADKQLDFANQHAAYAIELTRVQGLANALRDAAPQASNAAIDPELNAIDQWIQKAGRQAGRRLYENADVSLKEAGKAAAVARLRKQAHGDYVARLDVLAPTITGLAPSASRLVEAERQDLLNRLAAAKALADPDGKFTEARDALVALTMLVDHVIQMADAGRRAVEKGQAALENVDSDLPGSLAQVRKLLAALKARLGHEGIARQIQTIEEKLGDALPSPTLARQLIRQAAAECAAAAALADRHAAYVERRDKELAPLRFLLDDGHAYVIGQLALIETAHDDAEAAAGQQDYVAARARQDEVLRLIEVARGGYDRAERAKVKLEGLATHVAQLTDAKPRRTDAYIGGGIEALDQKLKAARTALTTTPMDLDALDVSVAEIERERHALKTRRLLRTGEGGADAVKQQMTQLHDLPDGAAALDEIMSSLPPEVDPDFVLHALELRFNLKAKGGGATQEGTDADKVGTRTLKRIYNVMVSVPQKHTGDNPRLRAVHRRLKSGSGYDHVHGIIVVGHGLGAIEEQTALDDVLELPIVDDDCKPENVPNVRFDWVVQHEIGHALDDKKNFMSTRAGDPAFGGWTDHGADVLAVAEAVAAAMAYPGIDKVTLAKYLTDGTQPAPLPRDWAKAKAWADAVRKDKVPWYEGDKCSKAVTAGGFVAGGRIYHEFSHNLWVSYLATARRQGITGYQFRAPGEWFAELYAAYHSKVLKPSHPSRAWLDKLFGVKNP